MTIRSQHLSATNIVVSKATGGADHVNYSRLLTNIFPYDDGTSLHTESSVAFLTIEDNDKDEGVEGALFNSKDRTSQL